jgi:cytochrome c-type biogenesis protein CcmH/NrfG
MTGKDEQPAGTAEFFLRARQAYGADDWAGCRAALEEVRALDPESMELKRWQARLAHREGNWQALADTAAEYLVFHPRDREVAQLCARALSNLKQWSAAALAWQRAAELRPDWPEAWIQLARAQLRADLPHAAAASARRLNGIAGPDAVLASARLALERGQMAEAAGHFARLAAKSAGRVVDELRAYESKADFRAAALAAMGLAKGRDEESYKAMVKTIANDLLPRALAAERRRRMLDAYLDYAVLAQIEPEDVIAKTGQRRTLQALHDEARDRMAADRKRAQKIYLQILYLQPGDSRALTALAQIAMAEQDGIRAAGLWAALLETSPADPRALVQHARALDRAQEFPRAIAAWRALLSVEPENVEAQLALAKLPSRIIKAGREAVEAGRHVEAVAIFSAVPEDSPEHADALRRLEQTARHLRRDMRAYYKARRYEHVVRSGTAAAIAMPQDADIQRLLGQAAMRTRDYALASAAWEKLVTLAPETRPTATLQLARCRLRLGQVEESRALLGGLLRDDPENAEAQALLAGIDEKHPEIVFDKKAI